MAASALIFAVGVTPLLRRVALQTGVIDAPAARKLHANPGAACWAARPSIWPSSWPCSSLATAAYINEVVGIFVGATLMSLMGLVDDTWGLGSYVKLAGQLLAAAILDLQRRAGAALWQLG